MSDAHQFLGVWDSSLADQMDALIVSTEESPFIGSVPLVIGTPQAAQLSVGANCTVAGNATFILSDGSSITVSVGVGWQTFPFAVTNVSASSATATYYNLK